MPYDKYDVRRICGASGDLTEHLSIALRIALFDAGVNAVVGEKVRDRYIELFYAQLDFPEDERWIAKREQ